MTRTEQRLLEYLQQQHTEWPWNGTLPPPSTFPTVLGDIYRLVADPTTVEVYYPYRGLTTTTTRWGRISVQLDPIDPVNTRVGWWAEPDVCWRRVCELTPADYSRWVTQLPETDFEWPAKLEWVTEHGICFTRIRPQTRDEVLLDRVRRMIVWRRGGAR